jgi:hypothetical protein
MPLVAHGGRITRKPEGTELLLVCPLLPTGTMENAKANALPCPD